MHCLLHIIMFVYVTSLQAGQNAAKLLKAYSNIIKFIIVKIILSGDQTFDIMAKLYG